MKYLLIASWLLIGAAAFAAEKDAGSSRPVTPPRSTKAAKALSPEAEYLAGSLSSGQRTKLLGILNRGDHRALTILPGVGHVRASAIMAARPYATPASLINAAGIGEQTFKDIMRYAKAGFPARAPDKEPALPKERRQQLR